MRICMVTPYPPQTGGVPVHTEGLASMLSEKHDVHVITYGRKGRKSGKIKITEVPVPAVPFLRGLCFFIGAVRALRRLSGKKRFDVIHSHFAHPPGSAASMYMKLWGKGERHVMTLHGSDILRLAGGFFGRRIVRFSASRADRIICVSRHIEEEAKNAGLPGRKLGVVYNGLDSKGLPKASKESLRKKHRLPKGPVVTFCGALTEAKGADIFMLLAEHLARREKDAAFLMVGGGPLEGTLKEKAEKAGIAQRVVFSGRKDHAETLELMKASDAVVVPSRSEGFGLTALEAMAMGVPVAASPTGALREVLYRDSVTDNLPGTVTRMLHERKFRDGIARENRKLSMKFSMEKMLHGTERAYGKGRNS